MKTRTLIVSFAALLCLTACKDKATVDVTGVKVTPATLSLPVGLSETLTANVMPSNASNKYVEWFSEHPEVANVDKLTGYVVGVAKGTTDVSATTSDGGFVDICTVTVTDALTPVTGVSVAPTTLSVKVDEVGTLVATIMPADASNQTVTWTSSNPLVAGVESSPTVDGGANVVALSVGTTTITATTKDGGKTATCSVTVTEAMPE